MYRTLVLVLSLASLGIFQSVATQDKEPFDGFKLVDKTGSIRKPDDYRSRSDTDHSQRCGAAIRVAAPSIMI
jgi:hypothetical protein